eukprot:scaffold327780_cov61-Tisochrysis_lutea.AAC.2
MLMINRSIVFHNSAYPVESLLLVSREIIFFVSYVLVVCILSLWRFSKIFETIGSRPLPSPFSYFAHLVLRRPSLAHVRGSAAKSPAAKGRLDMPTTQMLV